jgi:hypothetical protein
VPQLPAPQSQFDPRWFITHPYLFIDASWRDELPIQWPTRVIAPTFLGEDTDRCPVLLDVRELETGARDELMDRLAQQVQARDDALASLMIRCDAPAASLIRHLAARLVIEIPGQPGPKQLRYFDPGTCLQLPRLLGERGMAWLMGPIHSMMMPWAGHWVALTKPVPASVVEMPSEHAESRVPASALGHEPAFRLRGDDIQALLRLGPVNRVAMQLEPPSDPVQWEQRCAEIDRHVRRAIDRYHITQQADLVAFATHAVTHHPAFDDHPTLVAMLAQLQRAVPEDELDYRELSARLQPLDWQRIALELTDSKARKAKSEGITT